VRCTTPSSEGADRLSEAIRFGKLLTGVRLPAGKEPGVRFGVGRTSIHGVLRNLQLMDMVTIRPADGNFAAYLADGVIW
jgi:DNA-binding FadR family transcriptional regulator